MAGVTGTFQPKRAFRCASHYTSRLHTGRPLSGNNFTVQPPIASTHDVTDPLNIRRQPD